MEGVMQSLCLLLGIIHARFIIFSLNECCEKILWVRSLSRGKLLRNIVFPSIVDAIILDPGEHVFYVGGRDGKIYIAGLNAPAVSNSSYGLHVIGSLSEHSKAITCLAYSTDGFLLVAGSEDGMIRVWETRARNITRVFRHAKAAEVDVERRKSEQQRSVQMIHQWKRMYENLHQFCVNEMLNCIHAESANGAHV